MNLVLEKLCFVNFLMARLLNVLSCLVVFVATINAAKFVPGVEPVAYDNMDPINLYVDLITSAKTQIPFSYYNMNYCSPSSSMVKKRGNLGDKLQGGALRLSPYTVETKNVEACQFLCKKTLDRDDVAAFTKLIKDEYRNNWYLDGLPAVMRSEQLDWVIRGFPGTFHICPRCPLTTRFPSSYR